MFLVAGLGVALLVIIWLLWRLLSKVEWIARFMDKY